MEPSRRHGDRRPGTFESEQHRRLTYAQADALANRTANALLADGLRDGDIVLLFCENSVEAVLTKIAMAKAGAVAAPVNPSLAPDVIAELVGNVRAAAVIADAHLLAALSALFEEMHTLSPAMRYMLGYAGVGAGDRVLFSYALGVYATSAAIQPIRDAGVLPIDVDVRGGAEMIAKFTAVTRPSAAMMTRRSLST